MGVHITFPSRAECAEIHSRSHGTMPSLPGFSENKAISPAGQGDLPSPASVPSPGNLSHGLQDEPGGGADPDTFHRAVILTEIEAERLRQIEKHGHSAEADAAMPQGYLARLAAGAAQSAQTTLHGQPDAAHRKQARRQLVQCAATALAAIERIDCE